MISLAGYGQPADVANFLYNPVAAGAAGVAVAVVVMAVAGAAVSAGMAEATAAEAEVKTAVVAAAGVAVMVLSSVISGGRAVGAFEVVEMAKVGLGHGFVSGETALIGDTGIVVVAGAYDVEFGARVDIQPVVQLVLLIAARCWSEADIGS